MKSDTLINLIQSAVSVMLGIIAVVGAIFCNAHYHFVTAFMCFLMGWIFYKDDAYGTESVHHYFKNRYKKN